MTKLKIGQKVRIVGKRCTYCGRRGRTIKVNKKLHQVKFDQGGSGLVLAKACEPVEATDEDKESEEKEDERVEQDSETGSENIPIEVVAGTSEYKFVTRQLPGC